MQGESFLSAEEGKVECCNVVTEGQERIDLGRQGDHKWSASWLKWRQIWNEKGACHGIGCAKTGIPTTQRVVPDLQLDHFPSRTRL